VRNKRDRSPGSQATGIVELKREKKNGMARCSVRREAGRLWACQSAGLKEGMGRSAPGHRGDRPATICPTQEACLERIGESGGACQPSLKDGKEGTDGANRKKDLDRRELAAEGGKGKTGGRPVQEKWARVQISCQSVSIGRAMTQGICLEGKLNEFLAPIGKCR